MAEPAITIDDARKMGETGGAPTEAERLLFEAWMRGHCWAVSGVWNGETYVGQKESPEFIDGDTMFTRCLWAAWRDRAALERAKVVVPLAVEDIDDVIDGGCHRNAAGGIYATRTYEFADDLIAEFCRVNGIATKEPAHG